MAVPKQHRSKSRQGQRRAHIRLAAPKLVSCQKCKKPARAHAACPSCGFYRGREVVNVLEKLDRKERKEKEQELARDSSRGEELSAEHLSRQ